MHDIFTDELHFAVECTRENMPHEIKTLISLANYDLYHGPSGMDETYCGFPEAIRRIREWSDYVTDWKVYQDEMDGDTEVEVEIGSIDARDILREIVGKELLSYI